MPNAQEQMQVSVDPAQAIELLREGQEFFVHFFMGEELEYEIPQFHLDGFKFLLSTTVSRVALAWPRSHAKTTYAKLAVVWYLLFTDYRFVVYLSNTATVAKDALRDVIAFMQSDNFVSLFGEPKWLKHNETEGQHIFEINVPRDGRFVRKRCILKALGAGQQVRGLNIDHQRPQLAVVDDLEDNENTETEAARTKLRGWVYGPFLKALSRKPVAKVIWLGNYISNQALLRHICDSPAWTSMRYGCLKANGEPLWPDLWPLEALKADFEEYRAANISGKWMAEMMNLPMPDGMGLIKPDEIHYEALPNEEDIEAVFITIDPAISQELHADSSALAVHAINGPRTQIVETVKGKFGPMELFSVCLALCMKWRVRVVGIEAIQYQAALQTLFDHWFRERLIFGMEIVKLGSKARKHERIHGFASMLKRRGYVLTHGDIDVTNQILGYDPTKRDNDDDVIDACAYGVDMLQRYSHLIYKDRMEFVKQDSVNEYSMSAI